MLKVSEEIEKLVPYKPGQSIEQTRRELGLQEIVKLASNENALGPSPKAVAAISTSVAELHRYPDPAAYDLVQSLSRRTGLPAQQILIGNGSNELIDLLIRTFCEPRKHEVVIAQGSFVAYEVCAQGARVPVRRVPQTANLEIDVDRLVQEVKARPEARMVFLPNPNNPTGTYVSGAAIEGLLRALQSWDGLVVVDEAYLEFVRAKDYRPALSFIQAYSNVAVIHTFSKVYGIAGLRVGALYAPASVTGYLHRVRNPFNVNNLAQAGAIAALEDSEYIQQSQKVVWDGLDYFYGELGRLGLKYYPSQANFVLFDTGFDGQDFFQRVLRHGVILRPVGNYGLPTHMRMSVGLMAENRAAIAAIEAVLKDLRGAR